MPIPTSWPAHLARHKKSLIARDPGHDVRLRLGTVSGGSIETLRLMANGMRWSKQGHADRRKAITRKFWYYVCFRAFLRRLTRILLGTLMHKPQILYPNT